MIRGIALAALVVLAGCDVVTGTPAPVVVAPPVECSRIPAATCQQIVDDARRNAEPGTFPVRIRAACTRAVCTPEGGDVTVEVVYSNGRTDQYGMGWAGAVPAVPPPARPPLPVEPACQGVAPEPCRERAAEAWETHAGRADVVGIVVRCDGTCTPARGEGTTIMTFADGSSVTTQWGYERSG